MARTTRSSLNAHRSSSEPPPRQTISSSTSARRAARRDRLDQRRRRLAALHQARIDDQLDLRRAARERARDVVQRGSAERGHDADAARESAAAAACARARTGPRPRAWPSGAGTARTAHRRRRAASPRRRTAVRRAARRPPRVPRTSTCCPSAGLKSSRPAARRNIAQRISAAWPSRVLQAEVAVPAGGAREARDLAAHGARARSAPRAHRATACTSAATPQTRRPDGAARRRREARPRASQAGAGARTPQPRHIKAARGETPVTSAVIFVQVVDLQREISAQVFSNLSRARCFLARGLSRTGLPTKLSTDRGDSSGDRRRAAASKRRRRSQCRPARARLRAIICALRKPRTAPEDPPCFRSYKPLAGRSGPCSCAPSSR